MIEPINRTPWRVLTTPDGYEGIVDADGYPVGICAPECGDTRRLIIAAVNSHAALLAAAKEVLAAADDEGSASGDVFSSIEHLRAAIALAEEPAP